MAKKNVFIGVVSVLIILFQKKHMQRKQRSVFSTRMTPMAVHLKGN